MCLCEACATQEHRGHELVPLEQERALQEAEQPKVLSAVEDRMDELGAGIAQSRRTVALIKSAAAAERERVNRLCAEAAVALQRFQNEMLGFIEEGETTMLGRSQGDLQWREEQRSRLSQARHNLSQVPEADSVSFLQQLLSPRTLTALASWRVRRPGITSSSLPTLWTWTATRQTSFCSCLEPKV